ncbi:PREDICTED: hyaluronan mediated motility receptor-like isoform X1 [Trachymyrmex cornetzi]|uniref:hyaluronan mediated motility receptor-like isoform X1 n=1 Tax=Trachymyrmex cornetzi TaxID=471704 RepID=UPI00084F1799|nr:PREDICTED: hyaluronan mediated motility receptor-like isoform X1 [Trachymyrmex cornetzi]
MSFSKARIQRFNEFGSDAPPPGFYDPKFDNKVKGAIIEKSDRFLDNKSTSSAECNASVASVKSSATAPIFRVPQLPPKRPIGKFGNYPKLKTPQPLTKNQNMKYESNQQLADLQVECLNKDKTIQEHEKHIEDMKDEIRKLETELEELRKKQNEIETQHMKDIETMAKLQQDVINGHDDKHQIEMQTLRSQLLEMTKEKEREILSRKAMEKELRSRATELSKGITTLEAELNAKKEENRTKIETLETHIEELLNKLEIAKRDHDIEIELLQKEKCQLDICVTNLTQERSNLESTLEIKQNEISKLEAELSALQRKSQELKEQYGELTDHYVHKISDFTNEHEEEIKHLKNDFLKEKEELLMQNEVYKECASNMETKANKMEEINCSLTEELKNLQNIHTDVTQRLHEAQNELKLSNERHNTMMEKYKKDFIDMTNTHTENKLKLEKVLEDAADEYFREIENIKKMKDEEIEELKRTSAKKIEEETQQIMKHAQKMIEQVEADKRDTLIACCTESTEQVKKTIIECDAKVSRLHVSAMVEEARNTVEEEMRLANDNYKRCLLRMEVERTALDEKLSQRDIEITKLSTTLEELRSSVETQASFSQSLQTELDKAESELAEKKQELRALKDHIRTEAAEMVARKKRFELIMAENQASVAALTNRLAQSSAEVERLQYEVKRSEDCIREHKELLTAMRSNSQLVHEQVNSFMKELDAHRDLVDQHQSGNISQFDSLKSVFETKIQNLKQNAAKEIARLEDDSKLKTILNNELRIQLEEMTKSIAEAQSALLLLEEQNDAREIDISRMQLENNKILNQLKSSEKALEENKRLLQDQAKQHKIITDEANSRIEELSEKAKQFEEIEKTAKETTLLLEQERIKWKSSGNELYQQLKEEITRRKEAEEEIKKLDLMNEVLQKEYKEVIEKYVDVIGHQNPKQRIKHVIRLKDKNYELEQELLTKTRLVEQQQKTIEKLKAEEKRSHWKGKENIGMVHSTPISSPHKTLTPLRDRND